MKHHMLPVAVVVLLIMFPVYARGQIAQSLAKPWILSAPPRGSVSSQRALYDPLAKYLATVTHHKIIYRDPRNWLTYSRDMVDGRYDLIFDGPHFTSWRDRHLGYEPLVHAPEPLVFVVVTRRTEKLTRLSQLAGRMVCVYPPPYLGTLALLSQFPDVARQPYLVLIHGWLAAYTGLIAKRCAASVLPANNLEQYEKGRHLMHVLYRAPSYPNQALSAGTRIPQAIQALIRAALLSTAGQQVSRPLRHSFGVTQFVPANRHEYAGLGHLLDNTLYFSR